jgi:sigma-B regulation protein RsbU (phosphoserine phosphatase)
LIVIDPKIFYRELDSLLAKIGLEKSDDQFFAKIFDELRLRFGGSLKIIRGHLYEKRGELFVRVYSQSDSSSSVIADELPFMEDGIQAVCKHGSYIYDQHNSRALFGTQIQKSMIIPSAISIQIAEQHWLLVFELGTGWVREEIILFLNAVRTALNYKLFSELMQTEINMAAQIQKSLLPRNPIVVPGFDMAHFSQPAESVGGDFYDYYQFEEDSFGICLGDASGHGLPAALLARDVVIGLRMGLNKNIRIVRTIKRLNRVIQRSTYSTNFMSLFIGEFEDRDQLFYVNAGHPPPLLISGTKVTQLNATGIALGFLPDETWHRSHVPIKPNDVLVIYSDGIIERERGAEEQYGTKRLRRQVIRNCGLSAREILDAVIQDVYNFGKKKTWADDASLVIVKRL